MSQSAKSDENNTIVKNSGSVGGSSLSTLIPFSIEFLSIRDLYALRLTCHVACVITDNAVRMRVVSGPSPLSVSASAPPLARSLTWSKSMLGINKSPPLSSLNFGDPVNFPFLLRALNSSDRIPALDRVSECFRKSIPSDAAMQEFVKAGLLIAVAKLVRKGLQKDVKDLSLSAFRVCQGFVMLTDCRRSRSSYRMYVEAIVLADLLGISGLAWQSPRWKVRHAGIRLVASLCSVQELVPSMLETTVRVVLPFFRQTRGFPGPLLSLPSVPTPTNARTRTSMRTSGEKRVVEDRKMSDEVSRKGSDRKDKRDVNVIDAAVQLLEEAASLGSSFMQLKLSIQQAVEATMDVLRNLSYCEAVASVLRAKVVSTCAALLPNKHHLNCYIAAGMCLANLASSRDPRVEQHLLTVDHSRPWGVVPRLCAALRERVEHPEESWVTMEKPSVTQLLYTALSIARLEPCIHPLIKHKVLVSVETLLQRTCAHSDLFGDSQGGDLNSQLIQEYSGRILLKLVRHSEGVAAVGKQAGLKELIHSCTRGHGISREFTLAIFSQVQFFLERHDGVEAPEGVAVVSAGPPTAELAELWAWLVNKGVNPREARTDESKGNNQITDQLAALVESCSVFVIIVTPFFLKSSVSRALCNYIFTLRRWLVVCRIKDEGERDWLGMLCDESINVRTQGLCPVYAQIESLFSTKFPFSPFENSFDTMMTTDNIRPVDEASEDNIESIMTLFSRQLNTNAAMRHLPLHADEEDEEEGDRPAVKKLKETLLQSYLMRNGDAGELVQRQVGEKVLAGLLLEQYQKEQMTAKLTMQTVGVHHILDISEGLTRYKASLHAASGVVPLVLPWNQLEANLRPGDILLFQTKKMLAKVVQLVTWSQFDHVAVVLHRTADGSVQLLQAFMAGVTVTSFEDLRYAHPARYFSKLVLRQVQPMIDEDMIRKLARFARTAIGSPYGINPIKLGRRGTITVDSAKDNKRSYFCSELVAAVYRRIGLIETSKSCARFYPADFAANGDIEQVISANFSLGPEIAVDLDSDGLDNKPESY